MCIYMLSPKGSLVKKLILRRFSTHLCVRFALCYLVTRLEKHAVVHFFFALPAVCGTCEKECLHLTTKAVRVHIMP